MGVGYVLTEKLIYDKNGKLFTDGTWEYKPPDTKTVPLVKSIHANKSIMYVCIEFRIHT